MNHHPQLAALAAFAVGSALAIGGVYVLAGAGWALLSSALPCFGLGVVILGGARNG